MSQSPLDQSTKSPAPGTFSLDALNLEAAGQMIKRAHDPDTWENEKDIVDERALDVWAWADLKGWPSLQAEIAADVTLYFIHHYHGQGMAEWSQTLLAQAQQAKLDGRQRDYALFVQATLRVAALSRSQTLELKSELYTIYQATGEWFRAIYVAQMLAHEHMRLRELRTAAALLLSGYESSRAHDYRLGLVWCLIGFGDLFETRDPLLACHLLYKARLISIEIKTLWGISATDKLRAIRDAYDIARSDSELELDLNELIAQCEHQAAKL